MEKMLDSIKLDTIIINENEIKITCDHTNFCTLKRYVFPDIKDLSKQIKTLRKTLKENNVKLNKTNTLKLLTDFKNEYINAVNDYNNTFDLLAKNWKYTIENNLLKVGYSHNEWYVNNLRNLKFKLDKMNYRDHILSRIREIQLNVNEIEENLKYECNYISVSI